jgi:hypothetical protein
MAAEHDELRRLVDEMAELRRIIDRQQHEIAALREQPEPATRPSLTRAQRSATPRGSGRRSLLKWAGVAAAATAVSVMATEHTAMAADGDPITAGNTTQASSTTTLQAAGGSGASPLLSVDNTGATNASGLWGLGSSGFSGVFGQGNGSNGRGVYGVSDSGYGVLAASTTGIDIYAFGTGRLQQYLQSATGAPTTGTYAKGEQIRDASGDLYICTVAGTPGTWKKVAAIPAGKLGGALVFLPKPFRLFDTRPGVSGCPIDPGTPMTPAQIITLQVTGTASTTDATLVVPTGATGIIGDLICINTASNGITTPGSGFLTLQPHNPSPTGNSYLHYYGDDVVQIYHNSFTIGLDSNGKLDVGNFNASTNVGIDVMGYII